MYIYYLHLKPQLTLTGTGSDGISDEKKADIKDAVVDTIDVKFLCSACWESTSLSILLSADESETCVTDILNKIEYLNYILLIFNIKYI